MKLFALSAAVLASVSSVAATDIATACSNKGHPGIVNAIGKFCQNANMVVPSAYAQNGMNSDNIAGHKPWSIYIAGNCKPAQWVPQKYCFSQFYSLCASMTPNALEEITQYGANKCQTWHIQYGHR